MVLAARALTDPDVWFFSGAALSLVAASLSPMLRHCPPDCATDELNRGLAWALAALGWGLAFALPRIAPIHNGASPPLVLLYVAIVLFALGSQNLGISTMGPAPVRMTYQVWVVVLLIGSTLLHVPEEDRPSNGTLEIIALLAAPLALPWLFARGRSPDTLPAKTTALLVAAGVVLVVASIAGLVALVSAGHTILALALLLVVVVAADEVLGRILQGVLQSRARRKVWICCTVARDKNGRVLPDSEPCWVRCCAEVDRVGK